MKGLVIRAIVLAAGLFLVGAFVIDWNALVWEDARRETNDAQLRGDPTMLAARVSGYVAEVAVTDDQPVAAGALLYRIEDDDYRARVDSAAAEVAGAQAAIGLAQAQETSQAAQVDAASANAAATASQLQRAHLEYLRQALLLGTESGLPRAWQSAAAEERRQTATLSGDRSATAAAKAQIRVMAAGVAQAQAALRADQAQLDFARVQAGYTRIVAPEGGVVGRRLVRQGAYVSAGTALISLVPLDRIWAVANFREEQLAGMLPGQPAEIRVDAFPGVVLRGHVDSIEPDSQADGALLPPDRAVGNFTKIVQRVPVKIVLDGDDVRAHGLAGRLVPGLSVEAVVDTSALPITRAAP